MPGDDFCSLAMFTSGELTLSLKEGRHFIDISIMLIAPTSKTPSLASVLSTCKRAPTFFQASD
jgi:hypothetical protein